VNINNNQTQQVTVNQRYKSSTRIDTTVDNDAFVKEFIIHGTVISTIESITREFTSGQQRVYTLTGPYGSGKSTLAYYLSLLIHQSDSIRNLAQSKLMRCGLDLNIDDAFQVKKGWKVIKHVCGLSQPSNALLQTVYEAAAVKFDIDEIHSLDEETCLSKLKFILNTRFEEFDGVLFLVDEFGKALDYQSRADKDLYFFQTLADTIQQATIPSLFIGFLHQGFSEYARDKDTRTQKEWDKVQGRFRNLGFNPSVDESLVLVGDAVSKQQSVFDALKKRYDSLISLINKSYGETDRSVSLTNCLPIDPFVSLLLGPISRRSYSQNERSLFGFLASYEKYGFREFLHAHYLCETTDYPLYDSCHFWDYMYHNLHHTLVSSVDSKKWLESCDAVDRALQKGEQLHVKITKLIALLTVFGFNQHIHAKINVLSEYFKIIGYDEEEVLQSIKDLESWSIIIYRQKHDAFFVFQGTDIDLNALLIEKVEQIKYGVDWTTAIEAQQNILATSHYHETGTMRWAKSKLISKIDAPLESELAKIPLSGESFLTFVVGSDADTSKALYDHFSDNPHIAIGKQANLNKLKALAIELLAIKEVERKEERIINDLIAKKELQTRLLQISASIEKECQHVFESCKWDYLGETLDADPLTINASLIANRIYHCAPVVQNELVNRSKPSGSANAAIKKLMQAMLDNSDQMDLGFDEKSFPPEKGIYLSCLKSKGWHQSTEEGFLFPKVWNENAVNYDALMHEVFQSGYNLIKSSKEMVTAKQLYEMWMQPPFGLTSGLCRIYGLALLKALDGQVAYYDFDSTQQFVFIPELDEELTAKLFRYPHEAAVKYFEMSDIQSHLISSIAKASLQNVKESSILGIAKHIVKIIHTLPVWVKKTSGEKFEKDNEFDGLSRPARELRNKVIAANDPYKLILDDLPMIFGIDTESEDAADKLSQKLKFALQELSQQHDLLLNVYKQLISETLNGEFDNVLSNRAKYVFEHAQNPNLREFAIRLQKYIEQEKPFEQIINLAVGQPEKNWNDTILRKGIDELRNVCIQFRRIESFAKLQRDETSIPVSLISFDESGNEVQYSAFINNKELDQEKLEEVKAPIIKCLNDLSKEEKITALQTMLKELMIKEHNNG
jgi:energy-coupling factor transporter ATP-binding protein EcfA2